MPLLVRGTAGGEIERFLEKTTGITKRGMDMKILMLESSGNKHGSSNMLAEAFIRGAKEAGHECTEYDVLRADIRPCTGCGACGMAGPCVLKDDYEKELKDLIRGADMLVFVMPVYYYSFPAQLKNVVDRFYSFTMELSAMHKKTALLAVAWDGDDSDVFDVPEAYYVKLCDYMHFKDCGMVLGGGCGTPEMTKRSGYVEKAYELGRSL